MDSLLANYASSDEDDEHHQEERPPPEPEKLESKACDDKDGDSFPNSSSKRSGIFNSLPPPKSKSLFSSLPAPKSSLPSSSVSKKVVQFRPPTMMNAPATRVDDEDDDDDEDEKERQRKRSKVSLSTSSATSFLSSIPAPKHSATLGAMPSASGMGRRSMLETDTKDSSASVVSDEAVNTNDGYVKDQSNEMAYGYSSWSSGSESHAYYSGYGVVPNGNVNMNSDVGSLGNQVHEVYEQSNGVTGESYEYYGAYGVSSTAGGNANVSSSAGSYEANYSYGSEENVGYTNYDGSYGDYGNNAQYEHNWANVAALPEASEVVENVLQIPERRGRKDAPQQIVEVKQDELIKNRPREDQVKLTGIAFGPAYQPTSTKGKPTKLHKRKHQIGSLYFDMKQKEMELAERRAQGFLTKAQTQAKYGW